jgi:hypothetical protein
MEMSIEPCRNDPDKGKPKCTARNLSKCHFVLNKSDVDWLGIEHCRPRRGVGD